MKLIIEFIKPLEIAIVCYLLYNKIRPIKLALPKKVLLCICFIVLTSSAFVALKNFGNLVEPYRTTVVIIASSILFAIIFKEQLATMLISFVITYAFSYILHFLSTCISFLLVYPFAAPDSSSDNIRYVVTGVLSIIIAVFTLRIKVDFSPIFKEFARGMFLSISSMIIVLYGLFRVETSITNEKFFLLTAGFTMLGFAIYSWFKRENKISKDENAKDIINKKLQGILTQKEKDFAVLTNLHDYLASVVHRDDKTLDGMQRSVEKLIMRSEQTDVLNDAKNILDEISLAREEAERDYNEKVFDSIALPLTGLQIIDAKYETVSEKAMLKSVEFNLEINDDVSGFDQIIPQFDLANIIGDLAENAFVALRHLEKDQPCHKVQFTMSRTDNVYELSASDSGIPFSVDILIKLGVERVTSHSDDGGSGYGFETIFELLNEHTASLIITEYEPVPYAYSKSIAIKFDGNSEYIIKSFRAETIRKQNTNINLSIQSLKV